MEKILTFNKWLNGIVWGPPVLVLFIGSGLFLVISTKFMIYRRFGFIMKNTLFKVFEKTERRDSGVTPFQAVATALAATVGTGNIVGVTTAIVLGGPGAMFWMWLAALFGMTTKFSEVTLAVAYREKNDRGEFVGGPMYYIKNGLGKLWMARLFAFFGALAAFGIGNMTQAHSMADAAYLSFQMPKVATGMITMVLAGVVLLGGINRISHVAERLVPFMAVFYILGALVILFIEQAEISGAFALIFKNAFTGTAAVGGFTGATMMQAMRWGVARGVFTNGAGLGSAPIVHAAANTDSPVRQGLWATFEVFIDTMVICTMTALVLLTSGLWKDGTLEGAALATAAFQTGFDGGQYIVAIGLLLFAFTTILGWCYYGEKCIEFLLGSRSITPYRILFIALIFVGAIGELREIWEISDTLNGLMAIPNLIAVLFLNPVLVRLVKDFFADPHRVRNPREVQTLVRNDPHT